MIDSGEAKGMADEADNRDAFSRRRFLLSGAAALGAAAATTLHLPALGQATRTGQSAAGAASGGAKRKVLHIIGHSHIDAAWLWPWRDGSNTVLTTMRSALDRMKETPGFRYSHSSASHYEWVERADPKMFEEIKERVREGRWEVVGGWPVEPDCNIPSTESIVRQSLYGKNYFQRALGVNVDIGFNPDSFGHPAGLPSLLKRAGYRYYVFMRPQEHEMKLPLLFWWESPDGSRVLTLRIRRGYSMSANRIPDAAENNFQTGFDHAAYFLGVGNHGGSVTKEQIKQVSEMQQDAALPELRWSTVREFFAAVERSPAMANLPVVTTELQYHSRGVYSAYGEGKQINRRAERWLGQAEAISLAASIGVGHRYPAQDYAAAWWKVLFNQFHDLLAGTAQYAAYRDARDQMGAACDTAQTNTVGALEVLARRVDTRSVKEGAVFAFNPLPWPRKALVEYHTERNPGSNPWVAVPAGVVPITHLETKDGQKIPLQFRPSDSMTQVYPRISAWVDLPACGYKVLELVHGTPPDAAPYNNFFSVSDQGFGISSLKSADGRELLAAPVGLVVIADPSDTWSHGVTKFRQEMGRPTLTSSQQIEDGPVTRITRQRAKWNNSEIVLDIAQFKAIDAVELRFVIDWRERLEYRIIQLYSRDRGRREAQISFNVGQGSQDIGFRNDASILFNCVPSKDVTLRVLDEDGTPTIASFVIRDRQERTYPAKYKRLAPDFSFHPQIYRADGERLRLPAGDYAVDITRGPEYFVERQTLRVTAAARPQELHVRLRRWINPSASGWYSGDHHIHAAGCSHYEAPTQGVFPEDIMRHIKGEALNVGNVLTWGPCYYFQKQFFEAKINKLSTPANLLRYDVEVSLLPNQRREVQRIDSRTGLHYSSDASGAPGQFLPVRRHDLRPADNAR